MSAVQRWPLVRMETAFSTLKSRFWDVTVPYAAISLSYSFVTTLAVPFLLPEGLASIAFVVLLVFWILLSAALTVGAYAEIMSPSAPVPVSSFSFDAVTAFFERSWSELRKCLWTFYYVFEYAYLVPMLVWIALFVVFGIAAYSSSANFPSNPLASLDGGPTAVFSGFAVIALVVFVAYRQLKSLFAVAHAVNSGSADRFSFGEALAMTDGKWWSIFGNFLVVGLVFMWVSVLFVIFISASFGFLGLPRAVNEFLSGLLGPFLSIFVVFFTYELYKDSVPAVKKTDDIFVP